MNNILLTATFNNGIILQWDIRRRLDRILNENVKICRNSRWL